MRAIWIAGWLLIATIVQISQSAANPQRPVIVIPGILGSTLSKNDNVIWGDRFSLTRFSQLEISDGPRDPDPGMEAPSLIQAIQIFGPWKLKQYEGLRAALAKLDYVDGRDYFEFPYDWRQSNFTTAAQLRAWIDSKPQLKNREFDLLGHSMGGLVAEIFVRRHDPTQQVRHLITLGTPFLGSATAVATPTSGWGALANRLSGGIADIRRTTLSFPSIYELLPTYPNCCILGRPEETDRRPFYMLSSEGWDNIDWELAPNDSKPDRRDRVERVLSRARELSLLVQEPLPAHLQGRAMRLAGDLLETRGQFYVDRKSRKIVEWKNHLGDGTVVVRSAAKDQVASALISFMEHARIFDDRYAAVALRRILRPELSMPQEFGKPVQTVRTREGNLVRLRAIELQVTPKVLEPGEAYQVSLQITVESDQAAEDILPTIVAASDDEKAELTVSPGRVEKSFDGSKAIFDARGIAGTPGMSRIIANIPGLDSIEDYIAILAPK